MTEKRNLPSHRIFVVRNYQKDGEEKASWMEIGVAFQNKLGFSIQLTANPIDGRCVALPYEEKPYEARGDAAERSASGAAADQSDAAKSDAKGNGAGAAKQKSTQPGA